jgi:hypothetical protein
MDRTALEFLYDDLEKFLGRVGVSSELRPIILAHTVDSAYFGRLQKHITATIEELSVEDLSELRTLATERATQEPTVSNKLPC